MELRRRTEAQIRTPTQCTDSSCVMLSGLRLKCFFTVLDVHHDGVVTVVLLTKPRLCTGCVYFKISSNYLTMPSRYASQRKNAACIFGVNADSYSQNTIEES